MRTSLSILIQFGLIGGGGFITKSCPTLVTWWTVAHQTPLSMGFSRQEYWNGLPFYSPGDLPNLGIEPGAPILQVDYFTDWAIRETLWLITHLIMGHDLLLICITANFLLYSRHCESCIFFFLSLHLWALSSVAVKLVRNNFVLFSNSVSLVFKIFRQDWSHA